MAWLYLYLKYFDFITPRPRPDVLRKIYEDYKEELERFVAEIKPLPGQVGVVAFINGFFLLGSF